MSALHHIRAGAPHSSRALTQGEHLKHHTTAGTRLASAAMALVAACSAAAPTQALAADFVVTLDVSVDGYVDIRSHQFVNDAHQGQVSFTLSDQMPVSWGGGGIGKFSTFAPGSVSMSAPLIPEPADLADAPFTTNASFSQWDSPFRFETEASVSAFHSDGITAFSQQVGVDLTEAARTGNGASSQYVDGAAFVAFWADLAARHGQASYSESWQTRDAWNFAQGRQYSGSALVMSVTSVPEPATGASLLLGLGWLALRGRRQRPGGAAGRV